MVCCRRLCVPVNATSMFSIMVLLRERRQTYTGVTIQLRPMTTAMTKTIIAPILPNVWTNHSQTGRAFCVISHSLCPGEYSPACTRNHLQSGHQGADASGRTTRQPLALQAPVPVAAPCRCSLEHAPILRPIRNCGNDTRWAGCSRRNQDRWTRK